MNLKFEKSPSILPLINIFCLEESDIRHVKAFVKDGKVSTNKEMCRRKIVRMAYNHEVGSFELDEDGKVKKITRQNDALISFFSSQNLTPVWENANYTWGWFDEETGRWNGAVALVSQGSCNNHYNNPLYHRLAMMRQILEWIGLVAAMPAAL